MTKCFAFIFYHILKNFTIYNRQKFSPRIFTYPRHTVQNRPFPEIGLCFFDDVPDGSSPTIHEYWGVWSILPRKAGFYRACPNGRFWHGKSPQTPKCRRLQAPLTMERLNEKDATAFSAVFNHFHMKFSVSSI